MDQLQTSKLKVAYPILSYPRKPTNDDDSYHITRPPFSSPSLFSYLPPFYILFLLSFQTTFISLLLPHNSSGHLHLWSRDGLLAHSMSFLTPERLGALI